MEMERTTKQVKENEEAENSDGLPLRSALCKNQEGEKGMEKYNQPPGENMPQT